MIRKLSILVCLFCISISGYSATNPSQPNLFTETQQSSLLPFPLVMSVAGGVALINSSSEAQNNFFSANATHINFSSDNDLVASAFIGGFIGTDLLLGQPTDWEIQPGIAYYNLLSFPSNGSNVVGYDPDDPISSTAYNYHYNINSQQIFAETKLLAPLLLQQLRPYLLIDLGAAFNRTDHYTVTTDQTDNPNPTPSFGGQVQTNFAFGAGIGIDVDILPHLRAGVAYRWLDLGTAQLATGQWNSAQGTGLVSTPALKSNTLYANEFMGQISYML